MLQNVWILFLDCSIVYIILRILVIFWKSLVLKEEVATIQTIQLSKRNILIGLEIYIIRTYDLSLWIRKIQNHRVLKLQCFLVLIDQINECLRGVIRHHIWVLKFVLKKRLTLIDQILLLLQKMVVHLQKTVFIYCAFYFFIACLGRQIHMQFCFRLIWIRHLLTVFFHLIVEILFGLVEGRNELTCYAHLKLLL